MESSFQEDSQGWSSQNMKSRALADSGQGLGSLLFCLGSPAPVPPTSGFHPWLLRLVPKAGTQGPSEHCNT